MNIRTPIFGSLAAVGMFLASQAVFAQLPGSGGTLVDGDCTSTETFCAVLPICETLGAYCNYCSQAEERRNMACIGSTQDGCLWFGTVSVSRTAAGTKCRRSARMTATLSSAPTWVSSPRCAVATTVGCHDSTRA